MRAWVLLIGLAFSGVGLGVTLPDAPGGEELPPPRVTLHLTAAGTRHFGGNPTALPPAEDPAEDRALFTGLGGVGSGPGGRVRLYADTAAPASALVPILVTMVDLSTSTVDVAVGDGRRGFSLELGGYDPARLTTSAPARARAPLSLTLQRDAVSVARASLGARLSASGEARLDLARRLLRADRALHPGERTVLLQVAEDLPVGDVVAALSLARAEGYVHALVGVYPPEPPPDAPALPTVPPRAPRQVRVEPTGRITADGVPLEITAVSHFVEDCQSGGCVLAAVPATGAPLLVGARPATAQDPLAAFLFGRPVLAAPGFAAGLPVPALEGVFAPLARLDGSDSPTPAPTRPLLLGTLSAASVDAAIQPHLADVQACITRAPRPDLRGELVAALVVGPDGGVRAAAVQRSTLGAPDVEGCVLHALQGLAFARPRGGGFALVSYPLTFRP